MSRSPGRRLRVTIDSLAFGGEGCGREDGGRVVFVPGAAPGDTVAVELEEEKKGFARGRLLEVIAPSPHRVTAPCPSFHAGCGGCPWQHVALAAQRAAKEDIVRRALRRCLPAEGAAPIATPGPAFGWRRRARLRLEPGVVGFAAWRSHRTVDAPACAQLVPALADRLAEVRAAFLPRLAAPGELELLATGRGELHAAVHGAAARALGPAAAELVARGVLAGVLVDGSAVGAAEVDLADDPAPFFTRADAFLQASAEGNALLRRLVAGAAGPLAGARVLELYAGSGNFTRDLVRAGARVVAVENAPVAVRLFLRNVPRDAELVARPAEDALAPEPGAPVGLVVVDPPRTGLGPGMAPRLAALGAERIVYVSCDPPTLARDLEALVARGYAVTSATPVDLMPQTFHVEVVATLRRV